MDSSLQILVNIDVLLANMKERLMLHDEHLQATCVERITNLLATSGAGSREAVLSKLIRFDILSTLFDILQSASSHLLPRILDFLNLVIIYRKFYDCHIAIEAVDSILKVTTCILKSRTKDTQLFEKLVSIIHNILHRAVKFNIDFNAVCDPRRLLFLLRSLILENSMEQRIKFTVIPLLNIFLENIDLDEDWDGGIFEVCLKALDSMKVIVEYSDDEASIGHAAGALCAVCASATRLSMSNSDEAGVFDEITERRRILTKAIYTATMNTIVPYVRSTELNETDRVKFHRNLVTCLNNLYKLSSCNHDNLSNHLTANGYLKYFLLLTTELPENVRRSTCRLLSRIITTLANKSMSITTQWHDGAIGFETLMHRGLLDLPGDPQEWRNVMAHQESKAVALTTLIYYHFHGTGENDMICLESLITRIINLPKSQRIPAQILKVLWFLFAVASVSHLSPNLIRDYDKAVKRLALSLQYSRLNDCYTHHIDLLQYCLKCAEFPRDLRNKTLDLWLIESDGDIKPLLTLDCGKVVRHYLLLIIQTGYSEEIVNLAMKGIRGMIDGGNTKEIAAIAEIAWNMLPNLLSSYQPEKDDRIKAVLELANASVSISLSPSIKNRCADSLVNIILRREANLKLRTLAVMQSYALLASSVSVKPFTIFEKYARAPNFLEELLVQSFSEETPELSAVCMKLLAFIIHCQEKSSIQRDKPLTIDAQSLADLLFNSRRSAHCTISGMQLVLELFAQNIDASAVRLSDIANNADRARGVINLYEILFIVHGKSDPTQRDTVYQCLTEVLRFCHKHVQPLMYHLCTSMSNCSLVTCTLSTRYASHHFLEFVSTWLRCRGRYCNDEGPWNEKSLCKTPFEETLDEILKYVATAKDTGTDAAFNNLRYAVSDHVKISFVL